MEKEQLLTIIAVSFIVAVISSIATASITGNIIKLNEYRFGRYNVYTADEIDSKFNNYRAYSCNGDMICEVTALRFSNGGTLTTGSNGADPRGNLESDQSMTIIQSGLLGPTLTLYNKDEGGGKIVFSEKGKIVAGIAGATFGFKNFSILSLGATKIRLDYYTGAGNSYVCIDSKGDLFRSNSPCI